MFFWYSLFQWSNGCWQFDLWFLCLFKIQLEHLEVHSSLIGEAWLGEFWALYFASVWKWKWSHSVVSDSLRPVDCSPPSSSTHGILQARILEWIAISFSNAWKWKVKVKSLSRVRLLATPWTAAYQAPPSMGFSRREYWSGVPLPSPLLVCEMSSIVR